MQQPAIGQEVRFSPSAFTDTKDKRASDAEVTGKVIYVNPARRVYCAEFEVHGVTLKETFKY